MSNEERDDLVRRLKLAHQRCAAVLAVHHSLRAEQLHLASTLMEYRSIRDHRRAVAAMKG